jgi:hypothetical protein
VLKQLVAEHRFEAVDWMIGVAPEKILVSTGARKQLTLTAASQRAEQHATLEVAASSAN